MIAPVYALVAFAVGLLSTSTASPLDPGPSPECPEDMRLVRGTHAENVAHLCTDPKDGHCYAFWEGFTVAEGPMTPIDVCMDQFEAPNRRGARPLVMQSFESAERWCKQKGKRVCTEQEWELACEGDEHRPLAYGWAVNRSTCNSDKAWRAFNTTELYSNGEEASVRETERLWQGSPSGRYGACISPSGIYDLMGNVEEWVASRAGRDFPGVLRGGFWAKPWTGCRGANDAHEPSFRFYETGFRCCADPRQAP